MGQQATSIGLLVPEHIRKKFKDRWTVHVPLTYLTDKHCALANSDHTFSNETLTLDESSGKLLTTLKSLSPRGELDLTFDEWQQAWLHLLDLIGTYIRDKYHVWKKHYLAILNNETRAARWDLWLAYDTEIRCRSTVQGIDPSIHHILIWNELEAFYIAKRVKDEISKSFPHRNTYQSNSNRYSPYQNRTSDNSNNNSFRAQIRGGNNSFRARPTSLQTVLRCIFCGDSSGAHTSKNCNSNTLINGNPCHLHKAGPSEPRRNKNNKSYCYSWNGHRGCHYQANCTRGEHLCSLCGSNTHNAQSCPST